MSILERLADDMKTAMKAREADRLSCIRMLRSKMMEREVALRAKNGVDYKLTDDEAQAVVATYAKQRREAIEAYREGGRDELAAQEQAELELVSAYLPAQLTEAEIRAIVNEAVATSGASGPSAMGAVMRLVMPRVKGAADGKLVNRVVQEALKPES